MNFTERSIYHVYNRGNNRQLIFFSRENYLFFLRKMRSELLPFCDFISYCLMPNHFHWLILVKDRPGITETNDKDIRQTARSGQTGPLLIRKIANLLSSYSQGINRQERSTGGLFQKKTKAKKIMSMDDLIVLNNKRFSPHDDLFTCFNYHHQNPLKAALVKRLEDWEFSSFRDYAGLRKAHFATLN